MIDIVEQVAFVPMISACMAQGPVGGEAFAVDADGFLRYRAKDAFHVAATSWGAKLRFWRSNRAKRTLTYDFTSHAPSPRRRPGPNLGSGARRATASSGS